MIQRNAEEIMFKLLITTLIEYIGKFANEGVHINKNAGVVSSCIILSEIVIHINSDEIIFDKKEEFRKDALNQLLLVIKVNYFMIIF